MRQLGAEYLAVIAVFCCELVFTYAEFPYRTRRDCECGRTRRYYKNRIYGGTETRPYEYPWMAYVEAATETGNYKCGGSIINDHYILTAAHCVYNLTTNIRYPPYNVTVILGIHNLKAPVFGPTKLFKASRIFVYPGYTDRYGYLENDIALLKVKQEIIYDRMTRPICLPYPGVDYTGRKAIVAGWGFIKQFSTSANVLRHVKIKVLPRSQCLASYNNFEKRPYPYQILCTHEYNADAYEGDRGSPLMTFVARGVIAQIGVASFGSPCKVKNCYKSYRSGKFTDVTYFLNWIYTKTSDAEYCSMPWYRRHGFAENIRTVQT